MRRSSERHLLRTPTATPGVAFAKPPELTWPDYLVLLLRIGAEIEHALMVEYLYAAYSLGGDQVPEAHRPLVQRWQQTILTISREEMGHLLTVQNLLCLLGAPLCLERDDYPWDSPFYPFPFTLAPLSLDTLARFIYAEMPMRDQMPASAEPWELRVFDEVEARVRNGPGHVPMHHVAEIYSEIIGLLGDAQRIPDSAFLAHTFHRQASWDEWGKGYRPPPGASGRREAVDALATRDAHVYVPRMGTRSEALIALRKVAAQGEAPALGADDKASAGEPSHFTRFASIYRDWTAISEPFVATRNVPVNPTTRGSTGLSPSGTHIESPHSRAWASLFNLRYRMLLAYLAHAHSLGGDAPTIGHPAPRGLTVHRVFAEMYNVKAIAGILVRLPLTTTPGDARRAGPPFEMPYTLELPVDEADRWRLHAELLVASDELCEALMPQATPEGQAYLVGLQELDHQSLDWIGAMLDDRGSRSNR